MDCAGSGKSLCSKLDIKFLPTVRLFRDGKPLGDYSGERSAGNVREDSLLKKTFQFTVDDQEIKLEIFGKWQKLNFPLVFFSRFGMNREKKRFVWGFF